MNEKELLLSRARELKERSADNSMIVATNFLSPEERSAVSIIEKENNKYVSTFYYGGFPDAERTAAVFVPVFYEVSDIDSFMKDNAEENPFQLIECTKDKFTQMSHRDYLGSLMALGIKREMVGDIVVTENGYGKRTDFSEYRLQTRSGKGLFTYRITEKTGKVICAEAVTDNDDIMMITSEGIVIRMHADEISTYSRHTQGVD